MSALPSFVRIAAIALACAACAQGTRFDEGGGSPDDDGDGGSGAAGAGGSAATCAEAACDQDATCDDSSGVAVCSCNPGFDGDGKACTDVDECGSDPCGPNGTCTNLPGSYDCFCDPGYEEEGGTCVAQGSCAVDNGGCADACTCSETMGRPLCTCTITHSSSEAIMSANSVACTYMTGTEHAENSYYRVFDLPAFGVTGDFTVTSVEFGIELAQSTAPPQPATVKIHRLNGANLVLANLMQLSSTPVTVANVGNAVLEFNVNATATAGSTVVLELHTPDANLMGHLLYVGSNTSAETGPSYLRAPTCGFIEPTTTAAIGYPNMHIVMNLHGTYSP